MGAWERDEAINDEGGVTGGENFAWGVAIFHSFSLATAFANAYV